MRRIVPSARRGRCASRPDTRASIRVPPSGFASLCCLLLLFFVAIAIIIVVLCFLIALSGCAWWICDRHHHRVFSWPCACSVLFLVVASRFAIAIIIVVFLGHVLASRFAIAIILVFLFSVICLLSAFFEIILG